MLIGLLSVLVTMTAGSGDAPDASVEGRPAHATSPIPALFAAGDYPAAALAQKVQGSTAYRIQVNAAGRVEECEIERSSGSAALDSTTCRVIRSRARFYPAVNAEGRAVASVQTGTIEWKVQ